MPNEFFSMFDKWPKWLRWVLALPISLFISVLIKWASNCCYGYLGVNGISWLRLPIYLIGVIAEIVGFFFILYAIIPKIKYMICLIFSFIYIGTSLIFLKREIGMHNYISKISIENIVIIIATVISLIMLNKLNTPDFSRNNKEYEIKEEDNNLPPLSKS